MENERKGEKLVKVGFKLPKSDWHSHTVEWLWAEPLSNNLYRLRNSPFYAHGYSFLDVVEGTTTEEGIYIVKNIKPSNHSTYRIAFYNDKIPQIDYLKYIDELLKSGCNYESHDYLFTIDVPPQVDIKKIYKIMEKKEKEEIWGFQEGYLAPLHRKKMT